MCGVVSLIYENENSNLGLEAASLLKKLEYRGYDSTGAAFISGDKVILKKKTGAPSKVIDQLKIDQCTGKKFIGQVRWATFGAVNDENAQPHKVDCLVRMVGAHNGNISNTDALKQFLQENGHTVISDNDGEMLVHMVEHSFHRILNGKDPGSLSAKEAGEMMIKAVREADSRISGSYAACVTMDALDGIIAIKAGSSLYAGRGNDENGEFIVVSSDLTSVLSKTRFLIPFSEGEGILYNHHDYKVFSLKEEKEYVPPLKRSRLNISDITLRPEYQFFMEQEIFSTPANFDLLFLYYFSDPKDKLIFNLFEKNKDGWKNLYSQLLSLYDVFDPVRLIKMTEDLVHSDFFGEIEKNLDDSDKPEFVSQDAQLLREMAELNPSIISKLAVLDRLSVWKKKRRIIHYRDVLIKYMDEKNAAGGKIYLIGAGTSHNASLIGGYFFNNLGNIPVIPVNPGAFRSMYLNSLNKNDLLIAVSQSGETKDVVDVINDVKILYPVDKITTIAIVNNENSTIPQEKADFYLPILCGTEIAVAATKSFTSQCALFYLLASMILHNEETGKKKLADISLAIDETLKNYDQVITDLSGKFFLKPSLHILGTSLIGLAKEGALKIREVVLNHSEGFDTAEFKHGPNTILGRNTIYSLNEMENVLENFSDFILKMIQNEDRGNLSAAVSLLELIKEYKFKEFKQEWLNLIGENQPGAHLYDKYKSTVNIEKTFTNYPLIFICSPEERDRRITIAQIHTHKIRGADVVLIAEDDPELERAANGRPQGNETYYYNFIRLPKSSDRNIFVFKATVLLQLLALKMSVRKMKYLNQLKVETHGVHPDVPKNVSKSITVD